MSVLTHLARDFSREPIRARREPPNPLHRCCRRVKGGQFQARIWCGPDIGFVNLGLYPTAWAANRVAFAARRAARPITPLTLWAAALALPSNYGVNRDLLPKYVYPLDHGLAYGARLSRATDALTLRPFPDPESAFWAMYRILCSRLKTGQN